MIPDFLGRLAARSLGMAAVARPVLPPLFAPGGAAERFEPPTEVNAETRDPFSESLEPPNVAPHTINEEPAPVKETPSPVPSEAAAASPAIPAATPETANRLAATLEAAPPRRNSEPLPQTAIRPERIPRATHARGRLTPASRSEPPLSEDKPPRTVAPPAAAAPFVRRAKDPQPPILFMDSRAPGVPHAQPAAAPPAPMIRVTIGRVEVRADFPKPSPRPSPGHAPAPALSIEEYARQRSEGKR